MYAVSFNVFIFRFYPSIAGVRIRENYNARGVIAAEMIDQLTSLHLPHISCLIWLIVTTIENNPIFLQLAMMCCLMAISVNPREMLLFSFLHTEGNIQWELLSCRLDTSCFVTQVRSNRWLWSATFSVHVTCSVAHVHLKLWMDWLSSCTYFLLETTIASTLYRFNFYFSVE